LSCTEQNLKMESHIEGGYFKEDCKSDMKMPDPITGKEDRAIFTTCYYLLPQGQRSIFHRLLSSDEIWSYQKGDPIILFEIQENGEFIKTLIGPDLHRGHKLKSQSEEKYMDGS